MNWKQALLLFLILLFLSRYYDFFFLYEPVRQFAIRGFEPTIGSFLMYNYSLKMIFYLLKIPLIAAVLSAGIFAEGSKKGDEVVSYGDLLKLSLCAEFVYFLSDLSKVIWFTLINTSYTEQDYLNFYPFSLFTLFDLESTSVWARLSQSLNLFEVIYVTVVIIGLRKLQYNGDWQKPAYVVLGSYGSALIIWSLVLTYLAL